MPAGGIAAATRHGHGRRQSASGNALLVLAAELPVPPARRRSLPRREGEHREHAIFANDFCASAHPSDVAATLVALGATLHTNRRELPVRDLYRLPDEGDRRTTTLDQGEVLLELDVPPVDASVYLKAMDRKRWAFPLVGVAAVRRGAETAIALAGVAPIPWLLEGPLDNATPLPGTAYKVEIARALVERAVAKLA
jgi:xanthine dehydrogenase YagS FAD-binding subunit